MQCCAGKSFMFFLTLDYHHKTISHITLYRPVSYICFNGTHYYYLLWIICMHAWKGISNLLACKINIFSNTHWSTPIQTCFIKIQRSTKWRIFRDKLNKMRWWCVKPGNIFTNIAGAKMCIKYCWKLKCNIIYIYIYISVCVHHGT